MCLFNHGVFFFCRYCETVGLKGKFATEIELGNGKTFYYVIRMTGKMYKEVEGAEIILKTKGKDKPEKFSFMVNFMIINILVVVILQDNLEVIQ